MMADPLLAQSVMDRLQSAAYELVVEGESYRQRQKTHRRHKRSIRTSRIDQQPVIGHHHHTARDQKPPGPILMAKRVVPSPWQATRTVGVDRRSLPGGVVPTQRRAPGARFTAPYLKPRLLEPHRRLYVSETTCQHGDLTFVPLQPNRQITVLLLGAPTGPDF